LEQVEGDSLLMKIDDYAKWTDVVWKSGAAAQDMDDKDVAIVSIGLSGETGEALEYVKKYLRDGKDPRFDGSSTPSSRSEEFKNELADVLYYWCRLVRWAGYLPSDVIKANVDKLEARHASRLAERNARLYKE
jgi:NTP pyrophosphatase (non-canonical NTP hydrolase)